MKPIRAARVSEISETTASAQVSADEQVNFHIGNPLQDERLSSTFLRATLGIDVYQERLGIRNTDAILEYLGWENSEKHKIEYIIKLIQKSAPYMPRGGYSRKNPHALISAFHSWLEHQQEPLSYDTGEQTGRREIILASGGILETLRILFIALSSYLEITPAHILNYHCDLPPEFKDIPNLLFEQLSDDERQAREQIEQSLISTPNVPYFFLVGKPLGEVTRRKLRSLSINYPLYFIEANNEPNHLSLAREVKLVRRVIRLLTPTIFAPQLNSFSITFIAGNADLLSVLENVHFNLKGTPSAAEIELLIYILDQQLTKLTAETTTEVPQGKPAFDGLGTGLSAEGALPQIAERVEQYLERLLTNQSDKQLQLINSFQNRSSVLSERMRDTWKKGIIDEFSSFAANELLDLMIQHINEPQWKESLERSFISVFVKHQPQYLPEACAVVSGSARTALGILGFHCAITEVVIPDLSWSYEQCFQVVHAVPLTPSLGIDVKAMMEKVEQHCRQDSSWSDHAAVVINNPHNATSRIFDESAIRKLVAFALHHGLYVIDDLAYQNMAPVDGLPEIKTVRQIANELVLLGEIDEKHAERIISVHSMSKTDCLAGARLAVVEIREQSLRERFLKINSNIQPNLAAIFISYLFYRNTKETVRTYWHLRNVIFHERTKALLNAVENLPADRNLFKLTIIPPAGSMYPLLKIERFPAGLSLEWLSSSLARRGIGLLPLATFARTEKGFEIARTTFRLTLGGMDSAEVLLVKTRRLLIDLNRLIAEEQARYNRKPLIFKDLSNGYDRSAELEKRWETVGRQILQTVETSRFPRYSVPPSPLDYKKLHNDFVRDYLPGRLQIFRNRLHDRARISDELMKVALSDNGDWLDRRLDREFMKDSLVRRQELFRLRSFDRTVHPTQMYSIQAEMSLDAILARLYSYQPVMPSQVQKAAQELWDEFLGRNVAINSQQESDEILLDLDGIITSEEYSQHLTEAKLSSFLSFWSDWDGSNRPSGQGHRLVAALVMENVRRMARIFKLLLQVDPHILVDPALKSELDQLPTRNQHFTNLVNEITLLTHQLEQRYKGLLPYSLDKTYLQQLITRWHLRRDPAQVLWQHNDQYERKMLELRRQRRAMVEDYYRLNKALRKQLHALIPAIKSNRVSESFLREVVGYRDLLQRTVITPRIHQGMVTGRDQFAIDTTVYNLYEINTITGTYGNPGMVLALQVSFSSNPEALILLDRKMRTQAEKIHREKASVDLPVIWLIPLLEDVDSVNGIRSYLDGVWDYAMQSRQTSQTVQERFGEIIPEVFIAGSDLSQQVSQAAGEAIYRQAKNNLHAWMAEHSITEGIRIKLGSGEPMQRQGGYYPNYAGHPAFLNSEDNSRRLAAHLPAAAQKSTDYAVTPLQGILLGDDLRTFQSNLSEHCRYLPAHDYVRLLYHIRELQRNHRAELIRATETIAESRLSTKKRNIQELERITVGMREEFFEGFLKELTDNFRHILYGREEDVIGLHIISYFIGRSLPQLRDRTASRRGPDTGTGRSQQILANVAKMIPLAKHGSLLRAIAHNQSQTVVLGINQLTTGLFRALERFSQKTFVEAERERMIAEHLLPHLPVYEILSTLRVFQDHQREFIERIESALPAGNSSFVALREDANAMQSYVPLLKQELLRRHGVNVSDFFVDGEFIPELLPTLRPDLAVLLQSNLFNTDVDVLLERVKGRIDDSWRADVNKQLMVPRQVREWRSIIWDVIGETIYQRVQSFSELAIALYSFSTTSRGEGISSSIGRGAKMSPALAGFFRTAKADDEIRTFLLNAIEYLSSFVDGNIEVPVSIIRTMHDIERIAQIEESAIPLDKQNVICTCLLQIARLVDENG